MSIIHNYNIGVHPQQVNANIFRGLFFDYLYPYLMIHV